MPTRFPPGSSGTNSCTERDSVLKKFKAIVNASESKAGSAKGKRKLAVAAPMVGSLPEARNLFRFRKHSLVGAENLPVASRQIAKIESSNAHTNQTQRRMADGCRHSAHLAVLPF